MATKAVRLLEESSSVAINIAKIAGNRYQVSTRENGTDGWQIYYGSDLDEVLTRAATKGPQLNDEEARNWVAATNKEGARQSSRRLLVQSSWRPFSACGDW